MATSEKTYRGQVVLVLKPDGLRMLLLKYEVIDLLSLSLVSFCGKRVSLGLKWGKQVFQRGGGGVRVVGKTVKERETLSSLYHPKGKVLGPPLLGAKSSLLPKS